MKRLFALVLFISCSGAAFSQRVRSSLIPEVDDINTYADTMVAKRNVTTAVCYRCRKCKGKDAGVFASETTYDKQGRIIRVTTPQCTVNYKWLTDSTMESLADYAPGCPVLGFFM